MADVIYDETLGISYPAAWVDSEGANHTLPPEAIGEDLLQPVLRRGKIMTDFPDLRAIRERTLEQLGLLDPAVTRLLAPTAFSVGLESALHRLKEDLIRKAGGDAAKDP